MIVNQDLVLGQSFPTPKSNPKKILYNTKNTQKHKQDKELL